MFSGLGFEIGLLVVSYLFGSIPFSIVLGKGIKGIDVRKHGSGNPGGTNSIRHLGRKVGFLVVFLDGLKGGLIVLLIRVGVIHVEFIPALAFGTVAAIGHVFSIFIGFRGGKAVASTMGLITGFNVIWGAICVILFFSVLKIIKYVSIGSTSIPFFVIIISLIWHLADIRIIPYIEYTNYFTEVLPFFIVLAGLIIYRHQQNYRNIRNGVEPKARI